MFVGAKDMHYTTAEGREVLDGTAGLWCCNAGHCRPKITEAIQNQAAELDYAPAFQMGHPKAFQLATRLTDISPKGMDHVFFLPILDQNRLKQRLRLPSPTSGLKAKPHAPVLLVANAAIMA